MLNNWENFYGSMVELNEAAIEADPWLQKALEQYEFFNKDIVRENRRLGIPIITYIEKETPLFNALSYFYESMNKDIKNIVSDYVPIQRAKIDSDKNKPFIEQLGFCFTHGVGYDWIDKDLLGGNGSGAIKKEFEEFIERGCINDSFLEQPSLDDEIKDAQSASNTLDNDIYSNKSKDLERG